MVTNVINLLIYLVVIVIIIVIIFWVLDHFLFLIGGIQLATHGYNTQVIAPLQLLPLLER